MMIYNISIDCYCKQRKKVLKHIVKSIFRNNRYKSGVNIEEEELYIVSSDTDPAIHQTINIYDTRESISEAASIDVHFDRFGKKTFLKEYTPLSLSHLKMKHRITDTLLKNVRTYTIN